MKFAPMKRLAVLSLAVAGVGIGTGCDDQAEANKQVLEKMDSANAKLAALPSLKPINYNEDGTKEPTGLQAVRTDLSTAVGEQGASPVMTAVASSALGGVDHHAGHFARAELVNVELGIRRELAFLRQLVQQIALTNYMSAGYRTGDPAQAVTTVSEQIAAIQGNANIGLWGPGAGDKVPAAVNSEKTLPTLAAVKQEVSRLEGEIGKRQQQIEQLTKTRNDAVVASETALQKAETQKGDEAVKTYTEAAEQRRQADDTAIQIDIVNAQLARLQADLAVQKGQEATLTEAVAQMQQQVQRLNAGWEDLQKRAQNQTNLAKGVLEGTAEEKTSISSRAQAIQKLIEEARIRRTDLLELLAEAEKYYDNAEKSGRNYAQSITALTSAGSSNAASFRGLSNAIHPQRYKLQKGIVQREIGSIRASEAALMADVEASRSLLQTTLSPASLQVPSELESVDTGTLKDVVGDADDKLTGAINTLTEVETGDSGDPKKGVQNAAKVARLIALVNRMQLLELKASIGDTAASGDATSLKTDALALKKEILEGGGTLPPLPGEYGELPPPAPAPTSPDGAPATGPDTAPGATPGAAPGATPAAPAAGAGANTPAGDVAALRELYGAFAEASISANREALEAAVLVEPNTQATFEAMVEYGQAVARLEDSAVKRFPEVTKQQMHNSLIKGARAQLLPIEMLQVSGDEARVGDQVVCRRVNGQWKMLLNETLPDGRPTSEVISSTAKNLHGVCDELDSGAIADANTFGTRMTAAMQGITQQ